MNPIEIIKELIRVTKPIVSETVEQWSNGDDCYQKALDYINEVENSINN